MKRIVSLLIALMLVVSVGHALAEDSSQTYTSGDYQYKLLDDGTAMITRYNDSCTIGHTLEIPNALDGHAVVSFDEKCIWFLH